jgi:hypothetical protein
MNDGRFRSKVELVPIRLTDVLISRSVLFRRGSESDGTRAGKDGGNVMN